MAADDAVLPPMKPSDLRSIDDLLTDDEREELRADLRRIHTTAHPEWCKCQRDCGGDQ